MLKFQLPFSGRCLAAAAAALAALMPASASANDFQVRIGLGANRPADTRFADRDCASVSPAALYGCGVGGDGAPTRSTGGFGTAASVALGVGYAALPTVRLEGLLEYQPRLAFEGTANFLAPGRRQSVAASVSARSAMLAAYFDLSSPGLGANMRFQPFLGAGAGVARAVIGETRMMFPATTTFVPGGSSTSRAWMVTAGVTVPLQGAVKLDLAYRYADYGAIETGQGPGQVVWRNRSRDPLPLHLAPTRGKLKGHALTVSIRFAP